MYWQDLQDILLSVTEQYPTTQSPISPPFTPASQNSVVCTVKYVDWGKKLEEYTLKS